MVQNVGMVILGAMLQSTESKFATLYGRIPPRIRNITRKCFRVLIRGLGVVDLWKNLMLKIAVFKRMRQQPLCFTLGFQLFMTL
jgi:hypothetical protein